MERSVGRYRGIVVADIEDWSSAPRTDLHRRRMRDGLYESFQSVLGDIGVDWESCDVADTGDGLVILTPSDVPPLHLVEDLAYKLAAQLRRYNATHAPEARMRLRLAVNWGVIQRDGRGHSGQALTLACRLLDAQELREQLRDSTGVLAMIVPESLYLDVVFQEPGADPDAYKQMDVSVKHGSAPAWVRAR